MKHILVLDIEATGLDPNSSSLLELSAVRLSADLKHELAVFDRLVRPEEAIPPFIERLTGISEDMVKNAPLAQIVLEEFQEFLKPSDIICGHNIQFDIGFLNAKGYSIPNPSLDTFALAQIFLPEEPSYALEILTERYQIEHTDAHRALNDVRANALLLTTLLDFAKKIPEELRLKYTEILNKSGWIGKEILLGIIAPENESSHKERNLHAQPSLFEVPDIIELPLASKVSYEPSAKEISAGKMIAEFMSVDKNVLISVPLEITELIAGAEAARMYHETSGKSVAIAIPDLQGKQTPPGFYRFAASKDVICDAAYRRWFTEKTELSEPETIVALKYERERIAGNSMITADFPAVYSEKQVVSEWLDTNHSLCGNECSAKMMQEKSKDKLLYFCEYGHLEDCPAESVILLQSDNLIHYIDAFSRERFSLEHLEKILFACRESQPDFVDGVLFGVGLLKRFIREQVGDSPYSKNFVFENAILESKEVKNLAEGFLEASEQAEKRFPTESRLVESLSNLARVLTEPIEDNECRFASISGSDAVTIIKVPKELSDKLASMVEKKQRVAFVGTVFLRKNGKAIFGSGLDAPDKQLEIPSSFDFANESVFFVPQYGGNTKMSDESATTALVAKLIPELKGSLLVLFPSTTLAESFCGNIAPTAEQSGFKVMSATGSSSKLKAKLQKERMILAATTNSIKKIDFRTVTFSGCVQHRIFFDPPPDPATAARNGGISDNFLDFTMPRAIQRFQRLLSGLSCSGEPFFWACLDAGFQKSGSYTAEFLDALPRSIPVKQLGIPDIADAILHFLHEKNV